MSKAKVYALVQRKVEGNSDSRGSSVLPKWEEIGIELGMGESIDKLSWRAENWGSNNVTLKMEDMNRYVADLMTLCEAMITNEKQQEAWKKLLKDGFWDWYNDIFNRNHLDIKS